jgi:hypothetical protein
VARFYLAAGLGAGWNARGGSLDADRRGRRRNAIELHRTETANYRQNLSSGMPALWVVLRPKLANSAGPAFELLTVTADPAEGEALTDAGNDLVATVPMPAAIIETIDGFTAEHHVERTFNKRKRDHNK